MNKEEMEKIINDIKDSLWCLENKKCNIDTKEKSWETYYGLNDELIKYIRKIEQENKHLKDNWNKLKDYIGLELEIKAPNGLMIPYLKISNKIQELEKSGSNE